ncbi:TetR/AcrR family transcriptional regulator [Roseinatronobacter alkalisoli]|uniref:TetR/AcrR family transcriptional regulator n=1 Tax=Roseinatronobacter alkalisoli TaxID=3028235 RepID=A0ABT5T6R8_9RHOB|nr:TetR/AcrR family transcriptional regulator [Roseinatronobacter sp. HJB301]MDD7970811.1 TetR/AcrR family transcriptional regulator [Roseinatronobacter sp. HJB301]
MNRPRGRPPRDSPTVSRDDMLTAALHLLDTKGVAAFTMRALATRLQVNPMTIYHHFGDRDALVAAMAERVYSSVSAPDSGGSLRRIEALMRAYHGQVLRHPGLTLLVFSLPEVFPQQARRITDDIAQLLIDAGLTAQKARLWVNILVDFTHGAAIATAMGAHAEPKDRDAFCDDDYADALRALLTGLQGGS